MPVNTLHPDYKKFKPKWDLCRSLMESDAHKYILDIDTSDPKRSKKYREDAILTNFTARTVNGLVGLIFRKSSTVKLPKKIEYLKQDCTGDNMSLEQASKEASEETLVAGRYGVMADYPAVNEKMTPQEIAEHDLKARLYFYKTDSIINWCETLVNGKKVLKMVTLKECYDDVGKDGYEWIEGIKYITLRLDDNFNYIQVEHNKAMQETNRFPVFFADGTPAKEILFSFIGSRKNKPKPDISPMYDISCLNIGHLKNSASYEESIAVCGQPSLFITTTMSKDDFIAANPDGIRIGARKGHNLGDNGTAFLLQAQPNLIADQGMQRKEQQAMMIGARLLTPQGGTETAEAARIRNASEVSVLDSVATNVSDAFQRGLRWCAQLMGADPLEVEFQLNYEFFDTTSNPQQLVAEQGLMDRGAIGLSDLRHNLRKYGIIDPERTDDMIDEEVGRANPIL